MRVALVGDEFYPDVGGASQYAFELGRKLAKLDVETAVIIHAQSVQPEEGEIAAGKIKRLKGFVLNGPHHAGTSR